MKLGNLSDLSYCAWLLSFNWCLSDFCMLLKSCMWKGLGCVPIHWACNFTCCTPFVPWADIFDTWWSSASSPQVDDPNSASYIFIFTWHAYKWFSLALPMQCLNLYVKTSQVITLSACCVLFSFFCSFHWLYWKFITVVSIPFYLLVGRGSPIWYPISDMRHRIS